MVEVELDWDEMNLTAVESRATYIWLESTMKKVPEIYVKHDPEIKHRLQP